LFKGKPDLTSRRVNPSTFDPELDAGA